MRYLITGGCGFIGSNLADEVIRRGEELAVYDDLSRLGSRDNLSWLKSRGEFSFAERSISDATAVEKVIREFRPDVIFHLAGQVAMTTSIENPRLDFETNVVGTSNVLEAVRKFAPAATVVYSSTNKVYGDLEEFDYAEGSRRYTCARFPGGMDEKLRLDFRSPYGCSKGAADQYMLDYARVFGLNTVVFRHSSIFGGRQFSTFDQGWVGWFVKQALDQTSFTISGNGKQVRDVLFASDLVALYFSAVKHIDRARGQAFNIGGGVGNSLSLLELFDFLEKELSVKLSYRELPWRQSDQKIFVADINKAGELLEWKPRVSKEEGLRQMIRWVRESRPVGNA